MNIKDITRHRRQDNKSGGWQTDKAIKKGVKKIAKGVGRLLTSGVSEAIEIGAKKGANRIMKSKWWNS